MIPYLLSKMFSYLVSTVVNCVQCHPFDCVVATSGIDNTIKVSTNKKDFFQVKTLKVS